jgi:hypothetical protein
MTAVTPLDAVFRQHRPNRASAPTAGALIESHALVELTAVDETRRSTSFHCA